MQKKPLSKSNQAKSQPQSLWAVALQLLHRHHLFPASMDHHH